jgi:hypothetical protein
MSSAVNPDSGSAERGRNRNPGTGTGPGHHELVARQKEQFGGMKFGCSFFGWLTATGTAVLLSALLAAVGTALGVNGIFGAQPPASQDIRTLGLVSGIVLLVVVLIAYFAGGYVAGRLARFDGARNGFLSWVVGVLATIALGVLAAFVGAQYDVLSRIQLPTLPAGFGQVTVTSLVALAVGITATLVAAVLGGKAGESFHRRVDRAAADALKTRG